MGLPDPGREATVVDVPGGSMPPLLPLMLWETPPGLELALAQEGVPFVRVKRPAPAGVPRPAGSCFYDGRKVSPGEGTGRC